MFAYLRLCILIDMCASDSVCFSGVYICGGSHCFFLSISVPALRGKDYGKTKMRYPDYTETESGLQFKVFLYAFSSGVHHVFCHTHSFFLMLRKILCFMMQDLRMGTGPTPKTGDTVVVGPPSFLLAFVPCFTPY